MPWRIDTKAGWIRIERGFDFVAIEAVRIKYIGTCVGGFFVTVETPIEFECDPAEALDCALRLWRMMVE